MISMNPSNWFSKSKKDDYEDSTDWLNRVINELANQMPSYLNDNKYTKTDGRIGITTTAANMWWENNSTTYRSARFASGGADDFGTISISAAYTAPNALGVELDGTNTIGSGHGGGCAGLAAGNNFGAAFEADIWNISIFGNADMST